MIRAEQISVRLGGAHPVLTDVSATLERGQVVVIVGRNAAGKTTLLRALAALVDPWTGTVTWDGRRPGAWTSSERAKRVAYVAQRPTLSAAFSVRETVELGRYALAAAPARIRTAIADFGLDAIVDRPYHMLSVGQQQRVALARAWAQVDPDGAILLDEPFAAMDLAETRRAAQRVRAHAAAGGLAVVVLHDLHLAAQLADTALLIDAGRLVAHGRAGEVLVADRLAAHFGVPFRLDPDGLPEPLLAVRGGTTVTSSSGGPNADIVQHRP